MAWVPCALHETDSGISLKTTTNQTVIGSRLC